jgi:hypothetical protein
MVETMAAGKRLYIVQMRGFDMKYKPSIAAFLMLVLTALYFPGAATRVAAQEQGQTQPASQAVWTANQLDNLVAPLALYPDPLLGQMLVASTYPLETVEASQWLQRNHNLNGQALIDAAKQQSWDSSVQALVAVPDALAKLNQDIRWTTELGNAFLAQQNDVMDAVQRMRARAESSGNLRSTQQQTVTTQVQDGRQVVVIEPASPNIIYVPLYDPFYIWGPPVYGFYPPLSYPLFGFGFGIGYNLGFCFSNWGGWGFWGWGPNWFGRSIIVNNIFFHRYGFHERPIGHFRGNTVWAHDPIHRLGVPYRNDRIAAQFGGRKSVPIPNRSDSRMNGRIPEQRRQNESQAPRFQNPQRQRYQPSQQQFQPSSRQNRTAPQVQRFQYQSGNQASRQYRSAPQIHRAPQVQQFRSPMQPRNQAMPQFRSAPRMSMPQFNAGSAGRSIGGNGGFGQHGGGGRRR